MRETASSMQKRVAPFLKCKVKTLYARFGDLKLGETLEDGTDLGKVSSTLEEIGVQVLDDTGAMRDMGSIMEQLMSVWGNLNTAQKQATAVTIAGKYQYNRLMSLLENQELYEGYYEDAVTSEGTLDTMQGKYMESLKGKTEALKAGIEELISSLVDQDSFGVIIDGLTDLIDLFTSLSDAIGGGGAALTAFSSIATKLFSSQIGGSIGNFVTNRQQEAVKSASIKATADFAKQNLKNQGVDQGLFDQYQTTTSNLMQYADRMSDAELQQSAQLMEQYTQATLNLNQAQRELAATETILTAAFEIAGVSLEEEELGLQELLLTMEHSDAAMTELEDDVYGFSIALREILSTSSLFTEFLEKIYWGADESDEAFLRMAVIAESLQKKIAPLTSMLQKLGMSEQDLTKFSELLAHAVELDTEEYAQLVQQLKPVHEEMLILAEDLKNVNATNLSSSGLNNATENLQSTSNTQSTIGESIQGAAEQQELKQRATSYVQIASAVTSLAFAWQSFQSLGSLWANEDLSLGDKVLQTILNLSMTLPMAIEGLVTLNTFIKELKATTQAATAVEAVSLGIKLALTKANASMTDTTEEYTAAIQAQNEALSENALLQQAQGTSLTNLFSQFGKGKLKSVLSIIKQIPKAAGVAAAIIGAISIAWGVQKKIAEQSKEAAVNAAEEAEESFASISEAKNNFDEIYAQYEKGEASSSDLQEAASGLNDVLDDQSAKLQSAAGNWEAYNNQVDRAVENEKKKLKQSLERSLNHQNSADVVGKDNTDYVANGLVVDTVFGEGAQTAIGRIKASTSILNRLPGGTYNVSAYADVQEVVKDVETAYRILEESEESVRNNQNLSEETRERYIASLQREKEALDALRTEDYFAKIEDMEQLAKLGAEDVVAGLDPSVSAEDIKSAFKGNEQIQQYLDVLSDQEQVDWIASQLTDSTMAQTMLVDNGRSTLSQNLQDAYKAELSAGTSQSQLLDPDELMAQLDTALNSIPDDQKLNILSFLMSSDKLGSDLLEWIQNIIAQVNGGMGLDAVVGKEQALNPDLNEFGTAIDSTVTSEESAQIKTKIGISDEAYDVYENDFKSVIDARREANDTGRTSVEIAEDIIEAKKEVAKYTNKESDEYKEAQKKLEKLEKEQADYNDELHDTAIRELETQKGIENLSEAYDDFANAETDVAAAEAIAEMQDALEMVLNVEEGAVSSDFVQQHLEDVALAAEGNIDAIERLRAAWAQDMVANISLNVPDEELEAKRTQISQWIDEINAMNIQPGASIDDTAFIAGLNSMLAAGEITTDQINTILSSLGYDVDINYEGFEVPSLGWDENGNPVQGSVTKFMPKISANKRAAGGSGYSTPKSSSGSGGGGGGGGGSSYEAKTEDYIEDDPDRYEEVNAHLDRLSKSLEKIADEQERLTGKAVLENMKEQVALIQEQANWQQKKLDIQRQEAAELRDELSGYGISFDNEGYMTNYYQMHQKLIDEYNAIVDKYNADGTESGQEALAEDLEAAKDKLDDFNEAWERYDELMNSEIKDSLKTLEDLEDQIEDLRIEAFNAAVEASENIKDLKDTWAEFMGFMSGLDEDSPFRSLIEDAKKYENELELVSDKQATLNALLQWLPQYKEDGTVSSDNPFGENSSAYYEALEDAYTSAIESILDAESLYNDQVEDIIDGYDEIADRISDRMDDYANVVEQLEHYASVIETLYSDEDYDNLLKLKRATQDSLESSIEQARLNLAMWENELAKYDQETQPKIWEAIKEKVVEAQEDLNGLVEDAANATAEILEMAVDKTVKEWKDAMLGGDGDWMETQWELAKQNAEQYLDAVEESYEIDKLRSKYNTLANDTADLNLRKRINDQMQQELEYLQEKDKLSEYDVNYANAKLDILQKQIALEEALANKNQMKLRRDSQGNYSYVYTADKGDVEDARNDLLDSEFNAYEISKENYIANYDNYISAISAAAEQIKAINANTLLSEEEKAERTQVIYDNLSEYLGGIAEQIGVSEKGMLESVKYLAMDSSEIVAQNYADIAAAMEENWVDALSIIGVAVSEEFDNIIHNMGKFLDQTQDKWDEFADHTEEWADNINNIADEGTDGFTEIDDIVFDLNEGMQDLNQSTEDFFDLINNDLGTIDGAVGKLQEYEDQILSLKESSSQVAAQLKEAQDALVQKDNEIKEWEIKYEQATNPSANGSGSGEGGAAGISDGIQKGDIVGYNGKYYYDSWGKSPAGRLYSGQAGKVMVDKYSNTKYGGTQSKTGDYGVHISTLNGGDLGWVKESQLFDTGGYTGSWSDGFAGTKNGKMAWLHEKELVLNATDTENILNAVTAMRDVVAAMKTSSLTSFFSSVGQTNAFSAAGSDIQQNIEIYADFPAAESAAEIKMALEGLASQAVQYANRTR